MNDQLTSWMEKAAGGDAAALRSLLEHFGPQIWAEIDGQIGKPWRALVDADDVMQVTYLEAFLHTGQMQARDPATFASWLRRMAENNLRDAIKELNRQKRPSPIRQVTAPAGDDSYVALVELMGATSTTPSQVASREELARIVSECLQRLPPDYSTVIRLYDLEGRDIDIVAATMGRTPGAVHMLRSRAHERLRTVLGEERNFFSQSS